MDINDIPVSLLASKSLLSFRVSKSGRDANSELIIRDTILHWNQAATHLLSPKARLLTWASTDYNIICILPHQAIQKAPHHLILWATVCSSQSLA